MDAVGDDGRDPGGSSITRAVRTSAQAGCLWLWVNQLRRAPYSYDWIDNLGRRSPRTPDPRLVHTRPGDQLMYIFTVHALRPGSSLAAEMTNPVARFVFGPVTLQYEIRDLGGVRALEYTMWLPARGALARLRRYLLAWADLVMARKQLLTLTRLASEHCPPASEYDSKQIDTE